jgi:hypothetical protein
MPEPTTIYRYGLLAWLWRGMIALLLAAVGGLLLADGIRAIIYAVILLAPALFFGLTVATRVDRIGDGQVCVWTLIFWRRRIPHKKFGTSKMRRVYRGKAASLQAPAAWVTVRGSLPVYLDLLGDIPDRPLLNSTFRLPVKSPIS